MVTIPPRLSLADRKRLTLFRLAKNDPTLVPSILDAIREQALEALRATLATAEPKVLLELEQRINARFEAYKKNVERMLQQAAEKFVKDVENNLDERLENIRVLKGDKGDTPSMEQLLSLITPLLPDAIQKVQPKREDLIKIFRPIAQEVMTNMMMNKHEDMVAHEEEEKKRMEALVSTMVASEINKIKNHFGGGGPTSPVPVNGITNGGGLGKELTGSVNGSNTRFTLPRIPKPGTERVYLNGVRMRSGASNDYTISGREITFNTAPQSGDIIVVDIDAGY